MRRRRASTARSELAWPSKPCAHRFHGCAGPPETTSRRTDLLSARRRRQFPAQLPWCVAATAGVRWGCARAWRAGHAYRFSSAPRPRNASERPRHRDAGEYAAMGLQARGVVALDNTYPARVGWHHALRAVRTTTGSCPLHPVRRLRLLLGGLPQRRPGPGARRPRPGTLRVTLRAGPGRLRQHPQCPHSTGNETHFGRSGNECLGFRPKPSPGTDPPSPMSYVRTALRA